MEENRLRIVIAVMGQSDPGGAPPDRAFQKCFPADLPPCLFFRKASLPGIGSYIPVEDFKRNLLLRTHLPYIVLVPVRRLSPQPVMDMDCNKVESQFLFQFQEHEKKAYGVRASGYACDHTIFFSQHMISFHICFYSLIHTASSPFAFS